MEQSTLWTQLDRVLDPELDESIVRLGFVRHLEQHGSTVRVVLRLPTYWCSPNFVYLMADGVRRVLTELPGIESVRVELEEHFASEEISSGVSSSRSFRDLFPTEAHEELDELRHRFLVKGYASRLLVLVQALRSAGASDDELVEASLGQLEQTGDLAWLVRDDHRRGPVRGRIVERYLVRRAELGLPMLPKSPLLLLADGQAITRERFTEELRRLRATVVNLRASTALCEALLHSRQQWWERERKEVER